MVIQLPGYKTIFPNAVYEASEKDDLVKIIRLERYEIPTRKTVIDFVRKHLQKGLELEDFSTKSHILLMQGATPLDTLLLNFPDDVQQGIAEGEERYLKAIEEIAEEATDLPALVSDEYFLVDVGVLPSKIISMSKEDGDINSPRWYESSFNYEKFQEVDLGRQWAVRQQLKSGSPLPWKKLQRKLKSGRCKSRELQIGGPHYAAREAQDILKMVYDELVKTKKLQDVVDTSEDFLPRPSSGILFELFGKLSGERGDMAVYGPNKERRFPLYGIPLTGQFLPRKGSIENGINN